MDVVRCINIIGEHLLLTLPKEPFPRFLENLYYPILISVIDIYYITLILINKF